MYKSRCHQWIFGARWNSIKIRTSIVRVLVPDAKGLVLRKFQVLECYEMNASQNVAGSSLFSVYAGPAWVEKWCLIPGKHSGKQVPSELWDAGLVWGTGYR